MRKIISIYPFVLMGILLMLSNSCKKDESNSIGTVTDIDGNVYHTVKISTQVWMVENLKTTRYRNGDPISNITNITQWFGLTSGAYCNYNNSDSIANIYGRLYNWYAVSDNRKIAPNGWHVATDDEWSTLVNYLGGIFAAHDKLREAGKSHWNVNQNGTGTNETGFTALPGGELDGIGMYRGVGEYGSWWTSSEDSRGYAWYWVIFSSVNLDHFFEYDYNKKIGLSVRCVQD